MRRYLSYVQQEGKGHAGENTRCHMSWALTCISDKRRDRCRKGESLSVASIGSPLRSTCPPFAHHIRMHLLRLGWRKVHMSNCSYVCHCVFSRQRNQSVMLFVTVIHYLRRNVMRAAHYAPQSSKRYRRGRAYGCGKGLLLLLLTRTGAWRVEYLYGGLGLVELHMVALIVRSLRVKATNDVTIIAARCWKIVR